MDPANRREAIREVHLDEQEVNTARLSCSAITHALNDIYSFSLSLSSLEGADWLMVKPGLPYLDVILGVRQATNLPVAAYHVR